MLTEDPQANTPTNVDLLSQGEVARISTYEDNPWSENVSKQRPNFDQELANWVAHDLMRFADSWRNEISEESVKDESARLRRLLIDGMLQRHRSQLSLRGSRVSARSTCVAPWAAIIPT